MRGVGHVAGDAPDVGQRRETRDRGVEPVGPAGVEDESPAVSGKRLDECETEPLRPSRHDRYRLRGALGIRHEGLLVVHQRTTYYLFLSMASAFSVFPDPERSEGVEHNGLTPDAGRRTAATSAQRDNTLRHA